VELLIASLVAPLAAPLLLRPLRGAKAVLEAVDGFVLTAICGLVFMHVLPYSFELGGPWVIVPTLLGLAVPTVAERFLFSGRSHGEVHRLVVAVAMVALGLHAMMDGVALHMGAHHHEHAHMLAVGVVLHRLPLGVAIWWTVRPTWNEKLAWLVLAVVCGATIVGYFAADIALPLAALAHLQAFVAGSLLHVMLHHTSAHLADCDDVEHGDHGEHSHLHPSKAETGCCEPAHDDEHDHGHGPDHGHSHDHGDSANKNIASGWLRPPRVASGLGTLVGLVLLMELGEHDPILSAASPGELEAWPTFVTLLVESAPALLLAFVGAGLLRAFLRPASTRWLHGGSSASQALRGMGFGLPLPICSCGVLPLYDTLVRAGVPTSAAVAFLVATPELGIDALLISLPLLGTELSITRLITAAAVSLVVAVVVSRFMRPAKVDHTADEETPRDPLGQRLAAGLNFGLGKLFDTTAPWILFGLAVAALLEPLLMPDVIAAIPAGTDVFVVTLLGMPGYICATGATPIAAVLIHKGLSPGAALAFLLTGPATNLTTFGVLSRLHGRRGAVVFAAAVAAAAIGAGFTVNALMPQPQTIALHAAAEDGPTIVHRVSVAVLCGLAVMSLLRIGPRGLIDDVIGTLGGPHAH